MKNIHFAKPVKTGAQLFLLLAMLVLTWGPVNTGTAHAIVTNDNLSGATPFPDGEIPYTNSVDVSTYTTELNEKAPETPCEVNGAPLPLGYRTAWYKYTAGADQLVSFDTFGTSYDTYVSVWTGPAFNPQYADLVFVSCDDDTYQGVQSQVAVNVTTGTTYYIQVTRYDEFCESCGYSLVFNANYKNIDVVIGNPNSPTANKGYYVPGGEIDQQFYNGINAGPLQVTSVDSHLVASMPVVYRRSSKNFSYSELMGFPAEQAAEEYFFPWYAYSSAMNTQLRIVNVGNQETTVDVYIKGVKKSGTGYVLAPGASKLVTYSGVNNGPVRVVSTINTVKILASMRVLYKYSGSVVSYSEMIGLPGDQISSEYLFPWYKTVSGITSQLRIANLGSQSATVQVILGNTAPKTYTVYKNTTKLLTFTGKDIGPVRVVNTTPAVSVLASLKQIYKRNGVPQSYSEMMGYPADRLATEYLFPWYTNRIPVSNTYTLASTFRIVNVSGESTDVEVYIGGNLVETISGLLSGASVSRSYSGLSNSNNGPVRVVGKNSNAKILVSQEMFYRRGTANVSYSEAVGMPYFTGQAPTTAYLFPWYTYGTNVKSELRFGYP